MICTEGLLVHALVLKCTKQKHDEAWASLNSKDATSLHAFLRD